jgi:hypothetical protein
MLEAHLKSILETFEGVYRSIDIRAVLAESKTSKEFIAVFLKIRLTSQNISDVESLYKKIESNLQKVDYPDFKIIQVTRSIQDLNELLSDVQRMRIKLKGVSGGVKPVGTESQGRYNQ